MLYGRSLIIFNIENNSKRLRSTYITGIKGLGKTAILQELSNKNNLCYVESGTAKQMLSKMFNYYDIDSRLTPKPKTVDAMLEKLKIYCTKKNPILLIDDFDNLNKSTLKVIEKAMNYGLIIIASGEKKPKLDFRETISLPALDIESTRSMAFELTKSFSNELMNLIYNKSEGVPGKIAEICRDYNIGIKVLDINPYDKESVHQFIADEKPKIINRFNIMPIWLLFVVGFGFLMVRYLFYEWGDFHEGYLLAMFGYTSLILYRLIMMKDYEK